MIGERDPSESSLESPQPEKKREQEQEYQRDFQVEVAELLEKPATEETADKMREYLRGNFTLLTEDQRVKLREALTSLEDYLKSVKLAKRDMPTQDEMERNKDMDPELLQRAKDILWKPTTMKVLGEINTFLDQHAHELHQVVVKALIDKGENFGKKGAPVDTISIFKTPDIISEASNKKVSDLMRDVE